MSKHLQFRALVLTVATTCHHGRSSATACVIEKQPGVRIPRCMRVYPMVQQACWLVGRRGDEGVGMPSAGTRHSALP